ncbi:MAG TPA: aquaporin [Verrucomicrobiales bacterium]|jgi:aquaporin Z|nr:aquaporin [Verrucomicrobiales bacterium]
MITNKLIAEFIGTLFLVTAALLGGGPAAAAALVIVIYAMGHISGGHYNPAVSLGVFLRGRMSQKELIEYIVSQAAGALIAVLIYKLLHDARAATPDQLEAMEKAAAEAKEAVKEIALKAPFFKALVAEFLFTFLLVFTVLQVATTKALSNNGFYGAAIGLCVLVGALAVGSLTGGAFNPAVGLGLVASGKFDLGMMFVYLIGCFGGGVVAAIVFRIMLPHEHALAVSAPPAPPAPPAE